MYLMNCCKLTTAFITTSELDVTTYLICKNWWQKFYYKTYTQWSSLAHPLTFYQLWHANWCIKVLTNEWTNEHTLVKLKTTQPLEQRRKWKTYRGVSGARHTAVPCSGFRPVMIAVWHHAQRQHHAETWQFARSRLSPSPSCCSAVPPNTTTSRCPTSAHLQSIFCQCINKEVKNEVL